MTSLPWVTDMPMKTGEIFRSNEGQYTFMCFHCGLVFENLNDIINHCENHYQDEKYDVDTVPSESPLTAEPDPEPSNLSSTLPETILIDSPTTPKTTQSRKSRKNVQRRKKKKNLPYSNFPQNCPMCNVWCDNFQDHMKNVHGFSRVLQCFICKKFFKSFVPLKSHLSSGNHTTNKCYHCAMEPPIKDPSEPRRHKCLFCKEWFPNHIEFKIHFKDAHDKDADYFFHKRSNCNIFTCYICEQEFPLRYYLAAHMKIHHDKFLRHQCPTCGRRLRTFGQLTQHLKTHEGKIFECDQCDKQFPYYAKLRIHRESHRTELNFKCDECPKAFKRREYLKRHKSVHKNDKRYACKFCDARFNFTSGRRAHEKSQHKSL